ncbi:DUF4232 domain-containing protein [Streptomyces sp. NPDC050698]
MRTYPALPTALLAASLALTACQNGTGTKDEGAAHREPAAATATATRPTGDTGSGKDTSGPTDTSRGTGSGPTDTPRGTGSGPTGTQAAAKDKAKDKANAGKRTAVTGVSCNGSHTTVTARPVRRPLNHMLLTVENTGSKPCDLTYYPVLRFDEMQWVPQPIRESKPQAVTTLAPGESGYAGVSLSAADGSGEGGTTGHKLTVGFQGRTPNSDGGPSAIPALPAKGVYYDSTLTVTHWLPERDDALSY